MPAGNQPRFRGQRETQRIGTIVAAAVGVLFVVVVGWYVLRGGRQAPAVVQRPQGPGTRPEGLGANDSGELVLGDMQGVDIPVMDKKDPRRQVGLITFKNLDPLPAHRYRATLPEAWLYMEDGRSAHITAAAGNLYMPDRQKEPESGTLSGGVVARVYEAKAGGAQVDEATDKPFLTFETQSLTFDSTLGRVTTTDVVVLKSEMVDFTGHGIDVIFNQVRERLESCRVGAGQNVAVVHSGAKRRKPAEKKAAPTAQPAAPGGAVAKAPPPPPPLESLYRVDIEQLVQVSQGGRKLDADLLQVWARLIDNQLPEGAIAEVKAQAAEQPKPEATAPAATTQAAAAPAPKTTAPANGDITMRWTGPCVILPLETAPVELKADHLAARFTAEKAGAVRLADAEKGSSGHAGVIEYGATTGKLLLAGKDASRPSLTFSNLGTIVTDRIEGDLVHGLVHIPAAGELKDEKRDGSASWSKQADFVLAVRDGQLTGELTRVLLEGAARLKSKERTAAADSLRADFTTAAEQANVLSRLILDGHANAEQGERRIAADMVDATFGPPGTKGGDPEPRVVTATGNVDVRQKDSALKAGWLEARLARSPKGQVDVVSAAARERVRITRDSDQLLAEADELSADLSWVGGKQKQVVDLVGKSVLISRGGEGEKSSITGTQLRLDGAERSVFVFSGGTFNANDPAKKAVVTAKWSESMSYSETTGLLDAVGNVFAVSTPDSLSRDEIDAWRVKLAMRPRVEGKEEKPEVLRAEAIGSVLEREGGTNARLTSERFIADANAPEGRRRSQLQYIEGARVLADQEKGTADVPGGGKLVVVDNRTERPSGPDSNGGPALARGDVRGDTLFTWAGSLHMDRASGQADMHKDVRMTHRSLLDRQITNLDCDHLTAVGAGKGFGASSPESEPAFVSATATGAVFVTQGLEDAPGKPRRLRKELVADKVEYDAVKETLEAGAAKGGLVSFLDPEKGAPVSAKGLFWDLTSGRIEAKEVSPIVAPR